MERGERCLVDDRDRTPCTRVCDRSTNRGGGTRPGPRSRAGFARRTRRRRDLRPARGGQILPPRVPWPARRAVVGPVAHEPHAGGLLRLSRQRRAGVRVLREPTPSWPARREPPPRMVSFFPLELRHRAPRMVARLGRHTAAPRVGGVSACRRRSGDPCGGVCGGAVPVADLPPAGRPTVHLELVSRRRIHLHGAGISHGKRRAPLLPGITGGGVQRTVDSRRGRSVRVADGTGRHLLHHSRP